MDEATSALDEAAEERLLENIKGMTDLASPWTIAGGNHDCYGLLP